MRSSFALFIFRVFIVNMQQLLVVIYLDCSDYEPCFIVHAVIYSNQVLLKKVSDLIKKYHDHTMQTNPRHREEESQNTNSQKKSGRQLK